jgi:hypothetical protein
VTPFGRLVVWTLAIILIVAVLMLYARMFG